MTGSQGICVYSTNVWPQTHACKSALVCVQKVNVENTVELIRTQMQQDCHGLYAWLEWGRLWKHHLSASKCRSTTLLSHRKWALSKMLAKKYKTLLIKSFLCFTFPVCLFLSQFCNFLKFYHFFFLILWCTDVVKPLVVIMCHSFNVFLFHFMKTISGQKIHFVFWY